MRAWFVVALALSSAFAGCLTEEPTETVVEPTDSLDGGNETVEANNTAPTAILTASVLNGSAPLLVNLTVDGSDADGDNLTWSLDADGDGAADFGGNGSDLPSTVGFTYNATGNVTAFLTVSDGNLTAQANVTIEVLNGTAGSAGPALPPFGTPETWFQHFDGCVGNFFIDLEDAPGDVDNCILILALDGDTYSWVATVPSNGHAAGTSVSGSIHMGASDPGLTSFDVTLLADGTAVGTGSVGPAPHLGSALLAGIFSEFTYEFTLDAEVPAGAELTLHLAFGTGTRQTVIFGYEGDHASQFTIG